MPLNGDQFGELVAIVQECLEWHDLAMLARTKFQVDLENVAGAESTPFKAVTLRWVEWLEGQGRTADFIGYLWAERSRIDRVQRFYQSFLAGAATSAAPGGTIGPPDLGRARDKVIEFSVYFRESETQFGYLNVLKELHYKLHDLQGMRTGIDLAVTGFRDHPDDPDALRIIAEELQALACEAEKTAAVLTDWADLPWIGTFGRAATDLARSLLPPDLKLLERSIQTLRELPSQHQAALNADLRRTAKSLKADRLARTAAEVLTAFGAGGPTTAALAEFRTRLGGFGGLCDQLTRLIRQHDDCQVAEVTLAPFETLRDVASKRLPGWADVAERLRRVAAARPDDPRATTTLTALDDFENAKDLPTPKLFSGLLIRFRRLFNDIDKELESVTYDLMSEAKLLSVQLRTLTNVAN